jgi:ABC-type Mn2+/Zn2+ transport system ATPase subunit
MNSKENNISGVSLIVTWGETEIFSSRGKWLHPLFDLGEFLSANQYPISELSLNDKIAGKAAAFLIVRLGIPNVHIHLISEGALAVFNRFNLDVSFDEKVPAIQCKTEEIVSSEMDVDEVWQMLRRRAGRVAGVEVEIEKLEVDVENNPVLKDLDLHVKKGEHVVIKGPNGAGKSTLLKTILGVQSIKSGSVRVGLLEVGGHEWQRSRSIVGYVAQNQVKDSFPISASEVVGIGVSALSLPSSEIEHRVEIAMRRTGCFHLADRPFHELSGGEQQRVSIARCLCQNARLLLFDEPTSFLDARSKLDLRDLLNELWANEAPTVIIVSHDDHWISQFNWPVYEMNEGKLCSIC